MSIRDRFIVKIGSKMRQKIRKERDIIYNITSPIEVLNIQDFIVNMVIPNSIRNNVIQQWVDGILRDEIAVNNGISVGMISTIVNEARSQIGYLDLIREVALNLRKAGLDLNNFAFTLRLQNKYNRLGIDEELAESAVEKLHVHCFTKNLEISEFLSRIDYLTDLVNRIGVPIEQLDKYVYEKVNRLKQFDEDIQNMVKERNDLALVYKTTIPELEAFQQLRPIHEKLTLAENEMLKKDMKIKEKDVEIMQLKEQLKNSKL